MICDQVAVALQTWLTARGARFRPWMYSTYDTRAGATQTVTRFHPFRKGLDGKPLRVTSTVFVPNTIQSGEIYFNGQLIGNDTHFFTEVDTSDGWFVFDNISTGGIALADFHTRLTFWWAHQAGDVDISIGLNEVRRVQVPAATVRALGFAGSRTVVIRPQDHGATVE